MAQNDSPPLGKFLASSGPPFLILRLPSAHLSEDKATRDKAVKHLVQFLSLPTGGVLSDDLELAKLWKGIFYCAFPISHPCQGAYRVLEEGYWMSDKPLVQQALATELADILLKIPDPSSSLLFLKGFWQTIVREWAGIDRLRWADRSLELNLSSN